MNKRKRYVLFSLLAVAISVLFYPVWAPKCTCLFFQSFLSLQENLDFSFSSCRKEGSYWVFEQASISHQGELWGTSKLLSVKLSWNVRQKKVHCDLHTKDLVLFLPSDASSLQKWFSTKHSSPSFMQVSANLSIPDGKIMYSYAGVQYEMDVQFQGSFGPLISGEWISKLKSSQGHVGELLFKFQQDEQSRLLDFHCFDVPLPAVIPFCNLGVPFNAQYQVYGGTISGYLHFTGPSMGNKGIDGDLAISHVNAVHLPSQIHGSIRQVEIKICPDEKRFATLSICQPICLSDDNYHLLLSQGEAIINLNEGIDLECTGSCLIDKEEIPFSIRGCTNPFQEKKAALSLSFGKAGETAEWHCEILSASAEEKTMVLTTQRMSLPSLHFITPLLNQWIALGEELQFAKGTVDATLFAKLQRGKVTEFRIPHFKGKDFDIRKKNTQIFISALEAHGIVDLTKPLFLSGLSGSCKIQGGQWRDLEKNTSLLALKGSLNFEHGIMQNSFLAFQSPQWEGQVDWISPLPHEVVRLSLQGRYEHLSEYFSFLQRQDNTLQGEATFNGFLSPIHDGFAVDGEIACVFSDAKKELCSFSCELSFVDEPTSFPLTSFNPICFNQTLSFPFGFFLSSSEEVEKKRYILPKGWFQTNEWDLQHYRPLFSSFEVEGSAAFRGRWEEDTVFLSAAAKELVIENACFQISIPSVTWEDGQCTFSLSDRDWKGAWDLTHVLYREKITGLTFSESQGTVALYPDSLNVHDLETHCHRLVLGGSIQGKKLASEEPTWLIHAETCEGSVQDCQKLCQQFPSLPFVSLIPLEGSVHLWGKGLVLGLQKTAGFWDSSFHLEGMLDGGRWRHENSFVHICDLQTHFLFDSVDKELSISELGGVIWLGEEEQSFEWNIAGTARGCLKRGEESLRFAFSIFDEMRDGFQAEGGVVHTGEKEWEIALDLPTTHWGGLRPSACRATLTPFGLKQAVFKMGFSLQEVLDEINYFSRKKQSILTTKIREFLTRGKLQGAVALLIEKEEAAAPWVFSLAADQLLWKSRAIDPLSFRGKKEGKVWSLDCMSWRDFRASADVVREGKEWSIPFLGIECAQLGLFAIKEGHLDEEGNIAFQIPVFEVRLSELVKRGWAPAFLCSGHLQGKGEGVLSPTSTESFFSLSSSMHVQADDLVLDEGKWEGESTFSLTVHSDRGVGIEKAVGSFFSRQELVHFPFSLQSGLWSLQDGSWNWKGLSFHIPVKTVPLLLEEIAEKFPIPRVDEIKQYALAIRPEGKWEGNIDGIVGKNKSASLQVHMAPANYTLGQLEIPCRSLTFLIEPGKHLQFFGQISQQQKLFWMSGLVPWADSLRKGHVFITERDPREKPIEDLVPLTFEWVWDQSGLQIGRIEGFFSGIHCQLEPVYHPEASPKKTYEGTIGLHLERLSPLLPHSLADKIREWKIGEGYQLKGTFTFLQQGMEISAPHFTGELIGKAFAFSDYLLDTMRGKISFWQDRLSVHNLTIGDPALECRIPRIEMQASEEGQWHAQIPSIDIEQFRPSVLFRISLQKRGAKEAFLIQKIHAEEIKGNVTKGDWDGKGNCCFIHDAPLLREHPLLAIPSEIILRLGLDPHLFTPIRGKIMYHLRGDRIILEKFKNMYSEGSGSRFYLARGKEESWMDFSGNVHILIGMKHYNLFFKLAELFTVKMEGTLLDPVYSLSREKK